MLDGSSFVHTTGDNHHQNNRPANAANLFSLVSSPSTVVTINCTHEDSKEYVAFVLSSVLTFCGGLLLLLLSALLRSLLEFGLYTRRIRCFGRIFKIKWITTYPSSHSLVSTPVPNEEHNDYLKYRKQDWLSYTTELARELVTAQRQSGRILAICLLFCSIGSLVMYILDTYRRDNVCVPVQPFAKHQIFDQLFNLFFFVFFFIRFVAAYNKFAFWFELTSLVDFFTLPPSFVALFLRRNWIGFRFLRAIRLINIPDLLLYTGVLRSSRTISIARLCANLGAFLICSAGFVHLVENSGDFFLNFKNARELSFFDCLYYVVVTITTVGYGDFVCVTYIGKAFMIAFLLCGLAFFAMIVPQLNSLFGMDRRFANSYHAVRGRKHVVICGELNFRSLSAVIEDFLHPDREESRDIDVCILNTALPSIELEALMKRHSPYVSYFLGSAMQKEDLAKVLMRDADACILLVDRETNSPTDADFANIMRVIAVKNYSPSTRILLQLMLYTNKPLVFNIPHWTGLDEVICISELKLGLLSQSCLAFGFSTMMANVFRVTADEPVRTSTWRDLYCSGASMEIYTCFFSPYFDNKTFKEATLLCFKMGILLLAVEQSTNAKDGGHSEVIVNPGSNFVINAKTSKAFVLASSSEEAKRIRWLCQQCHVYGQSLIIPKLPCLHYDPNFYVDTIDVSRGIEKSLQIAEQKLIESAYRVMAITSRTAPTIDQKQDPVTQITPSLMKIDSVDMDQFDTTGMYYRCKAQSIENCTLNDRLQIEFVQKTVLTNHIVVCLFANAESPPIGLRSFMLPLRASNIRLDDLHPIVIIGDYDYLVKEWEFLCTFPEVFIYGGSPNSAEVMRHIRLKDSHTCVVVSLIDRHNDDKCLIDKSAILCTLCIRSFADTSVIHQNATRSTSYLKPEMTFRSSVCPTSKPEDNEYDTTGHSRESVRYPPTVTDLEIETNVQYVKDDDDDETRFELYRTTAFASGLAFVDTIIDYIISTVYYNERALKLIRSLLSGGSEALIEPDMMTSGRMMYGKIDIRRNRSRSRILLIGFEELRSRLHMDSQYISFGELFCSAMENESTLCMGIYRLKRLLEPDRFRGGTGGAGGQRRQMGSKTSGISLQSRKACQDRVVLTFPSSLMQMHQSDMVYVSQQFSISTESDLFCQQSQLKTSKHRKH